MKLDQGENSQNGQARFQCFFHDLARAEPDTRTVERESAFGQIRGQAVENFAHRAGGQQGDDRPRSRFLAEKALERRNQMRIHGVSERRARRQQAEGGNGF